jgi:hypothetical protein
MRTCKKKTGFSRGLADFAMAFTLFWIAAFAVSASYTRAHAVPLPSLDRRAALTDSGVPRPTGLRSPETGQSVANHKAQTRPDHALLLLSFAFAAIAALNLGFWRHLRRAYASPRRSVWRRG